jgi:hypothetical protein
MTMMNLTIALRREERRIRKAIDTLRERLTAVERASAALNGKDAPRHHWRRRLSAAARRRSTIAQKKPWAKKRATK